MPEPAGVGMSEEGAEPDFVEPWLKPSRALEIVTASLGKESLAAEAIVKRLRDGLVTAVARVVVALNAGGEKRWDRVKIPSGHWGLLQGGAWGQTFWTDADLEIWRTDGTRLSYYGIEIDPAGLAEWYPDIHASPQSTDKIETPSLPNKGGAPRKEFWDDLLLAMFERLWVENWQPKSQAEIQNAMLDWASDHGYSLGETSVKKPAKKLFLLTKK